MNKKIKDWGVRVASLTLAGACLLGGAALAAGDQDDPLITLSYLTKKATPEILEQVEELADERQEELLEQFNDAIESYKQERQEENKNPAGSASYTVLALTDGQVLKLGVGCEVMLRVGNATVSAATSPALIDISGGGTLENGGSLVMNHLYMATIADRTLTAVGADVKLLIRGEYTLA